MVASNDFKTLRDYEMALQCMDKAQPLLEKCISNETEKEQLGIGLSLARCSILAIWGKVDEARDLMNAILVPSEHFSSEQRVNGVLGMAIQQYSQTHTIMFRTEDSDKEAAEQLCQLVISVLEPIIPEKPEFINFKQMVHDKRPADAGCSLMWTGCISLFFLCLLEIEFEFFKINTNKAEHKKAKEERSSLDLAAFHEFFKQIWKIHHTLNNQWRIIRKVLS